VGAASHVAPAAGISSAFLNRWGVTADLTTPSVVSRSPTGTAVPATASVAVTFTEPVIGVSATSLTLTDVSSGSPLSGAVAYNPAVHVATLKPSVALVRGHTFRVALGNTIQDAAGNALAPTSWTFATLSPFITLYSPPRSLYFAAGTTTAYRFDANGGITATKRYTLAQASSAATSQRNKAIAGHPGAWFYVVNGVWAGYWVQESVRVYLPGVAVLVMYSPNRLIAFGAGAHTGYRFDVAGRVTQTRSYTLARSSSASADRWAVINGGAYVYIVNGVWAGYWMPLGAGVTVR
jgi:hypothetical protein